MFWARYLLGSPALTLLVVPGLAPLMQAQRHNAKDLCGCWPERFRDKRRTLVIGLYAICSVCIRKHL